ncbi:MAG: tyrosine-type recombinase/integrase [Gemmatimonadales bacterium]
MASLKARRAPLTSGHVTLATLFDKYDGSPAFRAKKVRTQAEDRRKLEQVMGFLGRDRDATTIGPSDVQRYVEARMSGQCGASGKPVRARAVAADLVALNIMLNWATRERKTDGTPLLPHNPMRGIRLPAEKNPRRPIETYDRYLKLMRVAGEVDWRLPLALTLAESTGQRISAILHLRREDLALERLPYGWVQFRAEHQKNGCDHWVPLTKNTARLFRRHMRALRGDAAWLFPADKQPTQPVDRWLMSRRLRAAYQRAGLKPLSGGLWHPFRRKFATERKHLPLRDVAAAGGWKEPRTLLECYQLADNATLQGVVLGAPKLFPDGLRAVTPSVTPTSRTRTTHGRRKSRLEKAVPVFGT